MLEFGTAGFWTGVGAGVGFMVVFGWMVRYYMGWINASQQDKRPQVIVLPTKETPEQVVKRAAHARRIVFGLQVGAIFFILNFIHSQYGIPGAEELQELIINTAMRFYRVLMNEFFD
jgi:hypothetical protein